MANPQDIRATLISPKEVSLRPEESILRAMELIERSQAKIALVVDEKNKLAGSATDGDLRRGLMRGCTLQSPIKEVMHTAPYSLPVSTSREQILDMMYSMDVKQIPLLNADGSIAGIAIKDRLSGLKQAPRSNHVVIMAGGKGKRLLPITSDIPKPMVEINGRPMLEWIVQRFQQQGFTRFTFAINYLGHMIEDYFGNGTRFNCQIDYLREQEFMGTAGALSLLDKSLSEPLLVINGDILAAINYGEMLDQHTATGSMATLCARQYRVEVPYGVIQTKEGFLDSIVEKPVYEELISAGVYALSPEALSYVPKGRVTDMPTLLHALVQDKKKVGVFTLRDEWMDIGRHDDLERARLAFAGKAS